MANNFKLLDEAVEENDYKGLDEMPTVTRIRRLQTVCESLASEINDDEYFDDADLVKPGELRLPEPLPVKK